MRSRSIILVMLVFLSTALLKSQDTGQGILFSAGGFTFPYNLLKPEASVKLPTVLREISGLQYIKKNTFAAIQDEKGNIYIIDFKSGAVDRKIDFADDGDYEDLALVDKDAWVLKSNGDLYRVKDFLDDKERTVKKYETDLSKKNDLEGLCHDPRNERLLMAGKGHPYIDREGGEHKKAVYSFSLENRKLSSKPEYIIDLEEIKYYKKYNTMTRLGIDLMANLDASKGDVTFQPSGLAIHPLSGFIYMIGAVGDLLLVLHPAGEILAMVELDDKLFNQPEGISFSPDGELYISNEAGERSATILKFSMQK